MEAERYRDMKMNIDRPKLERVKRTPVRRRCRRPERFRKERSASDGDEPENERGSHTLNTLSEKPAHAPARFSPAYFSLTRSKPCLLAPSLRSCFSNSCASFASPSRHVPPKPFR